MIILLFRPCIRPTQRLQSSSFLGCILESGHIQKGTTLEPLGIYHRPLHRSLRLYHIPHTIYYIPGICIRPMYYARKPMSRDFSPQGSSYRSVGKAEGQPKVRMCVGSGHRGVCRILNMGYLRNIYSKQYLWLFYLEIIFYLLQDGCKLMGRYIPK